MYESVIETGTALLSTYGLVVLFIVFVLEGALVGKLIPTRALFVAAVLVVGTSTFGLLSVFLVALVGSTAGQLALFVLVRRTAVGVDSLPGQADSSHEGRIHGWLRRWGLPAIAISNVLPVVRGTLTVPAAMSDASTLRFSSAAILGTAVYAGGLLVLAVGLELLISL